MRADVCWRAWLTLGLAGAQLAGQPPALAGHLAAAALGLGGVEGLGHGTLPRLELSEAEALPGVCSDRGGRERDGEERSWTLKASLKR